MDTQFPQSAVPPGFAQYAPQLLPQGFPIGGLIGGGIGGPLGNPTLGRPLGQTVGMMSGGFVPFSVDPLAAAYAQQAQLAPQGFFGNLLGQIGQPLGGAIGSIFGNQQLGSQLGGAAGQFGRFLPFQAVPGFPAQGGFAY